MKIEERVNRVQINLGLVYKLGSDLLAVIHNEHIGSLYRQKRQRHGNIHNPTMSDNGESTIFGLVRNLIGKRFAHCYPYTMYQQPFWVKEKETR